MIFINNDTIIVINNDIIIVITVLYCHTSVTILS